MQFKGIPQSELRVPGNDEWTFSEDDQFGATYFNMIHTAIETGHSLSEFFAMPSEMKALLIVYQNIIAKMKASSNKTKKKGDKVIG